MKEIFELISSMAPYLLLGFFLAGIMHAFVPDTLYRRYMGGNSFRSVLNATLLGIPLPLCSCGVIPTAMSLRKEGASKGATVAFLISTPQTGIDSIIATYSLMGLPFALLRPLVALITSLFGGYLVNKLDAGNTAYQVASDSRIQHTCKSNNFGKKLKSAFHYAFVDMMQDIGKWLVIGLIVAGLITVFIPDSFFATFADKPLLSMMLVLLCAIPMYLCATGSIPIAVALMLKGLSPGTALVLLMAGPAVNTASMLVIGKVMGKKTLMLYLLSIISGAILFGLGIDYLLPREWFVTPLAQIQSCHNSGIPIVNLISTILLATLLVHALIRKYTHPHTCHCKCKETAKTENSWNIQVKGMSCNHCKSNVEKAILQVEGVERVEVDLSSGQTSIYGHANRNLITEAIESLGFKVEKF